MIKTILKIQILSGERSNSIGKNISLPKNEVSVDFKSTESPGETEKNHQILEHFKISIKAEKIKQELKYHEYSDKIIYKRTN